MVRRRTGGRDRPSGTEELRSTLRKSRYRPKSLPRRPRSPSSSRAAFAQVCGGAARRASGGSRPACPTDVGRVCTQAGGADRSDGVPAQMWPSPLRADAAEAAPAQMWPSPGLGRYALGTRAEAITAKLRTATASGAAQRCRVTVYLYRRRRGPGEAMVRAVTSRRAMLRAQVSTAALRLP
jgi:hypothetical protein